MLPTFCTFCCAFLRPSRAQERARGLTAQLLECQEQCRALQAKEQQYLDHVKELTDSMRAMSSSALAGKQVRTLFTWSR